METNTSSTLSPSSSSSHISLSSTLQYSYIPEYAQINESQFPIMSTYNLYKQKTSLTRSIRTLISSLLDWIIVLYTNADAQM